MAGLQFEQLRMSFASGLIVQRTSVVDLDRIFRIEFRNAMVFHVHAGHAVTRGRQYEALIETDF